MIIVAVCNAFIDFVYTLYWPFYCPSGEKIVSHFKIIADTFELFL